MKLSFLQHVILPQINMHNSVLSVAVQIPFSQFMVFFSEITSNVKRCNRHPRARIGVSLRPIDRHNYCFWRKITVSRVPGYLAQSDNWIEIFFDLTWPVSYGIGPGHRPIFCRNITRFVKLRFRRHWTQGTFRGWANGDWAVLEFVLVI